MSENRLFIALLIIPGLFLAASCDQWGSEAEPPIPSTTVGTTKSPAGTAPFTIGLTAYCDNPSTRMVWDFGDGSEGSSTLVYHTYSEPGTYTVTLTVYRDETVISVVEKVDFIRVFRELNATEMELVSASNEFGFDLFREIAGGSSGENVFVSPLSIAVALAMVSNGAVGSTKEEIRTTLRVGHMADQDLNDAYKYLIEYVPAVDPNVDFRIANSVWTAQLFPASTGFISDCQEYFHAETTTVDFDDFATVGLVNDWVAEKTAGAIDEIAESFRSDLAMLILNALYFNGMWASPFDPADTKDDLFGLTAGSETPCRMMVQVEKFSYFEGADFQAVELPYGNGSYCMTVLLPRAGSDADTLIEGLNGGLWDYIREGCHELKGTVELPKFTLEYETRLNGVLASLGMSEAFIPRVPDFSGIGGKPGDLYISDASHKTFIEVNEEGTRAAAVTAFGFPFTSAPPPPFVFRADRPFVIVIWEKNSKLILFMGKIQEPGGG